MAQVYTVTASTSIVLINSLTAPNTVVLLSSIRYPGHIVGIRDTTGSNQIKVNPVIVSTMNGLKFYDGTSSIVLNQPNGSLSVSSRDATTWQLLNTAGFYTTLSNGFVESLTSQNSYISITSTVQDSVSSMVSGRVQVLKTIEIQGNTNIQGDITIGGSLDIFSSARAYQDLFLSSGLTVGGNVSFPSTLFVQGDLTINSNLSTGQTVVIRENLTVANNLYVGGVLLPSHISSQTLTANSMIVGGTVQSAGNTSTVQALITGNTTALGKGTFVGPTFVVSNAAIADSLAAQRFQTSSLIVEGAVAISQNVTVSTLSASGSLSTLGSLLILKQATEVGEANVQGHVNVTGSTIARNMSVQGTALISSIAAYNLFRIYGDSSSYGSTFVTSGLELRDNLGIGKSLLAGEAALTTSGGMSTFSNLTVYQNLGVDGLLNVPQTGVIQGGISGASTLYVAGSVSTQGISATGELFVDGNMFVRGVASASTLGAPISLSISTLSLSNTFTIGSFGYVPELQMNGFPSALTAGPKPNDIGDYDLYVNGIYRNQNSTLQTENIFTPNYQKLWKANTLQTSTFGGNLNISTMLIGTANVNYPLGLINGLLVTGTAAGGGSEQIYYASNVSTTFYGTGTTFSLGGYKIRYNGLGQWMAAGRGATASASLLTSYDGYAWTAAASGGFASGANDVQYGGGLWVAVGNTGGIGPATTIQYSGNGVSWSNVSGVYFPATGSGQSIAYNGSNQWVAAGDITGSALFGLFYSSDGMSWSQSFLNGNPGPPFSFQSVGYGGGRYLASASTAPNVYTTTNGSNWSQLPTAPVTRRVYAYLSNANLWIGGGDAVSGNPTTTIQLSPTQGSNWIPINTGGFTTSCYDLLIVPEFSTIVAVGANAVPFLPNLQYAQTLSNWIGTYVFNGAGRGVAYGPILAPQTKPYFTANLTTIFRSTFSTTGLTASTITASSFFGTYSADGSLLTRIGSYTSSILVSSATARAIRTYDISANSFTAYFGQLADSVTVNRQSFLSAGNIFLAAGSDSLSTGNIQTSGTGSEWTRALDSNFEYSGNDIAGNSNTQNPLYVAVGADARTLYTIQTSQNGRVWSPITSGGFSYATTTGIHEGTSVVYNSALSRWVALGKDIGGSNTIQYSSDALNWTTATGGFPNFGTKVKVGNSRFLAFGDDGATRWSADGITWNASFPILSFTAIAYGQSLPGNVWVGITGSNVYFSLNDGQSWSSTGSLVGAVTIRDVAYVNYGGVDRWIAVGDNRIFYSLNALTWFEVTTSFPPDVIFNSVVFNQDSAVWVAGAKAITAAQTIWKSADFLALTWSQATVGGFSTTVEAYGAGYGVASLGFTTFAVGKSALDINFPLYSRILQVSTLAGSPSTTTTTVSLTNSNASNVFSSIVRGIGATPSELYKYVAVGDGTTPQKTIGRSLDGSPGSWLPAITGGFNATGGYGITYYQDRWLATGDATATLNTIQYSPDGANWFGTNTANGIRSGGRGIAVGISTLASTFVAVGKDTTTSSIVCSQDGYNWSPTLSGHFNVQGNAVAGGLRNPQTPYGTPPYPACFVAVGTDTRGRSNTILTSDDGSNWVTIPGSGGFTVGGYGVAYSYDKYVWVAVGEDANPQNTIQVSVVGGDSWGPAGNAFTKAGYGVTYNSSLSTFFAVGEDLNGNSELTIKTSPNGTEWFNVSSPSGFISQKNLGTANGLFTQGILTLETLPYLDLLNLVIYERQTPFLYPKPTVRLQSSFMSFNESLFVTISSQVIIGSNAPVGSADVSVYGTVFAPSLTIPPLGSVPANINVSTLIVSTLNVISSMTLKSLRTPSLEITSFGYDEGVPTTANIMATTSYGGGGGWMGESGQVGFYGGININNALYAYNIPESIQYPQPIGIGAPNSPGFAVTSIPNTKEVVVDGSFGASSLSTFYVLTSTVFISSPNVFFKDQYMSMFESTDNSLVTQGNRLQVNPSSMTFNSLFTLQISTQRLGLYTRNPQFEFDVQRHGVFASVKASTINAALFFLTLQSI